MVLPGDASASSLGRTADDRWIIGTPDTAAAARIARAHGARAVGKGSWSITRAKARAFARALRAKGLLDYAQPNTIAAERRSVPNDPLSNGWRDYVADPALDPPAVTADSPLLAVVDSGIDTSHPEWAGAALSVLDGSPTDSHGTAVAGAAAAPVNGVGTVGIWPGMRVLGVPIVYPASCEDITRALAKARAARPRVINMSFGSDGACYSEFVEIELAYGAGAIPVAAAGNEFQEGNPPEFPATFPHVFTIAAIDADGQSSQFSNANDAVDISAPGEGIILPVPPQHETDGDGNGYEAINGTSFASPMVAAAAAWISAARPGLTNGQVMDVLRVGALDLGPDGFDQNFGWGLARIDGALAAEEPAIDPGEPNEDIEFVNGRRFQPADKPIHSGGRPVSFDASIDQFEDPDDVYRIRVPGRKRVRVTVTPSFGDADLMLFSTRARTIGPGVTRGKMRGELGRSLKSGTATERLTFRNKSRRAVTIYAAVRQLERFNSGYRIRVSR